MGTIYGNMRTIGLFELRDGCSKYEEDNWGLDIFHNGDYVTSILHKSIDDFKNFNDEELNDYLIEFLDSVKFHIL